MEESKEKTKMSFFPRKKQGLVESHSQEEICSKTGEVSVALCVLIAFFHQHRNEAHRIQMKCMCIHLAFVFRDHLFITLGLLYVLGPPENTSLVLSMFIYSFQFSDSAYQTSDMIN